VATVHTQLNNQLVTAMLILIVMKTAAMHEDRALHTNVNVGKKNVPTSTICRCSNHPQGKGEKLAIFKDTSPCLSSSE